MLGPTPAPTDHVVHSLEVIRSFSFPHLCNVTPDYRIVLLEPLLEFGCLSPRPQVETRSPALEVGPGGRGFGRWAGFSGVAGARLMLGRSHSAGSCRGCLSHRARVLLLSLLPPLSLLISAHSSASPKRGSSLRPPQEQVPGQCFLYSPQNWQPNKPLFFSHCATLGISL